MSAYRLGRRRRSLIPAWARNVSVAEWLLVLIIACFIVDALILLAVETGEIR